MRAEKNLSFIKDFLNFIKIKFTLSKSPILITGCGRSGTTLLISILSAHPDIFAIPFETSAFYPKRRIDSFKNIIIPFPIYIIYEYLIKNKIKKTANRWCEKTPIHVRFINEILKYFGSRVKIIHIIRDGRDVITSVHPTNPLKFWVSPERWINDTKLGLLFQNNPQVYTIKYEDIILDFNNTMSKLCNFLNIKFNNYILNWYRFATFRKHEGLRNQGNIEKLYSTSIGRWNNNEYYDIVKKFTQNPEAIRLLKYLNYL
ncbi:MAG: sulfotransferase family protein [Promethearchaeota archaeon]